ncbi:MAG TPA: L-serine ammonia-lyase, iron-sulfur-dependent, subunit alpha [Bacilli bacterium]|nr:L-serine ammonia-lyase, iron-sulfur-dependent, subunit alpha [Bacilli bacterium]HQC33017.1 L-serine ammonia-lyase, iron-sulfur-dependent, subunit alpha [Bacilli bacterium]
MKSIRELYRIGQGPSSSHTMGPQKAAAFIRDKYPRATSYDVVLYGSLAFTGRGHLTDKAIINMLAPRPCIVTFDYKSKVAHANTFDITIHQPDQPDIKHRILSLGGGAISIDGETFFEVGEKYAEKTFDEIKKLCLANNWRFYDYVADREGPEIWNFLAKVWKQMKLTIENGLNNRGFLPGSLKIYRRAGDLYNVFDENETLAARSYRMMSAYAFATGEENASGGIVVTAPTCGSSGTIPALLKYMAEQYRHSDQEVLEALATAALIGNVIKHNASISGAEAGCQAEIGTACSMAAAAYAELLKLDLNQIESAAEIALEHNLGLTCDPIGGYVQIPCIERNAVAASKAITATLLAKYIAGTHAISFDSVVATMLKTGKDMRKAYRETAKGGLANLYKNLKKSRAKR